jgi:hypothetical protein
MPSCPSGTVQTLWRTDFHVKMRRMRTAADSGRSVRNMRLQQRAGASVVVTGFGDPVGGQREFDVACGGIDDVQELTSGWGGSPLCIAEYPDSATDGLGSDGPGDYARYGHQREHEARCCRDAEASGAHSGYGCHVARTD